MNGGVQSTVVWTLAISSSSLSDVSVNATGPGERGGDSSNSVGGVGGGESRPAESASGGGRGARGLFMWG